MGCSLLMQQECLGVQSRKHDMVTPGSAISSRPGPRSALFALAVLSSVLTCSGVAQETQIRNGIEGRLGWEIHRQSIAWIVGYRFIASKSWSFVPELHFVAVLTPAVSLRYELPLSQVVRVGISGGLGLNFPPYPPAITSIAAISTNFKVSDYSYWSIEGRIISPILESTRDNEVGGTLSISRVKSLRKFPPLVISLGYEF